MAATASELRRIYANLFNEPNEPDRLRTLKRALSEVDRTDPISRAQADRVLFALNEGIDPELTFTQLECLRVVLSQREFAPLIPTPGPATDSGPLVALYKRLFAEADLAHLRALQQVVFEYDKLGTEPKRLAVLALLNEICPEGRWTDAHVGALDALLVRDITFKHVAPFQLTGDTW